jgi:hypothetical protein
MKSLEDRLKEKTADALAADLELQNALQRQNQLLQV